MPQRVIHEEDRDAIVVIEIGRRHVLMVAGEIGETQSVVVENLEKSLRSTAVLDVGPPGLGDGGDLELIQGADHRLLAIVEWHRAVVGSLGL